MKGFISASRPKARGQFRSPLETIIQGQFNTQDAFASTPPHKVKRPCVIMQDDVHSTDLGQNPCASYQSHHDRSCCVRAPRICSCPHHRRRRRRRRQSHRGNPKRAGRASASGWGGDQSQLPPRLSPCRIRQKRMGETLVGGSISPPLWVVLGHSNRGGRDKCSNGRRTEGPMPTSIGVCIRSGGVRIPNYRCTMPHVRTRRRLGCVRVSRDVARRCHYGGQGSSKVHMLENM